MSDDPSAIGLQHPAFAVSKLKLLQWLNDFFELSYTKVEECATGAIYCQIIDCLFPGSVPMSRVKWGAKSDYEFVENFKMVQKVMNKNNISKPVPIDKLIKAKYQDNLEFLQWFKHFFECRYSGTPYNAKERRGGKGGKTQSGTRAPAKASTRTTTRPTSARAKPVAKKAPSHSDGKLKELNEQIATLQGTVESLEKERDFYFGKLRAVEVLCQESETEENPLVQQVLQILYKTDEDEGDAAGAAEATEAACDEDETF